MLSLEICVDTAHGLIQSDMQGVDRIELCSALAVGGLTPSAGLMKAARDVTPEVHVMIRPRAGDFAFSADDIAMMCDDIRLAKQCGLAGVVLGAARDGELDVAALTQMVRAADGMHLTLHRVIDTLADWRAAMNVAIKLGFGRVLTSGGAGRAVDGLDQLAVMQDYAAGRIDIMVGSGVSQDNVAAFAKLGITSFHASCSDAKPEDQQIHAMGFGPRDVVATSQRKIAALRGAIDQCL